MDGYDKTYINGSLRDADGIIVLADNAIYHKAFPRGSRRRASPRELLKLGRVPQQNRKLNHLRLLS